jgi:hypothetical protein
MQPRRFFFVHLNPNTLIKFLARNWSPVESDKITCARAGVSGFSSSPDLGVFIPRTALITLSLTPSRCILVATLFFGI